jgi:hypothetical protein
VDNSVENYGLTPGGLALVWEIRCLYFTLWLKDGDRDENLRFLPGSRRLRLDPKQRKNSLQTVDGGGIVK